MDLLRKVSAVLAFLVVAGCSYGPTQDQIDYGRYGDIPDQAQSETSAKAFFETYLKDSESARYKFTPLSKGWMFSNRFEGSIFYAGYILEAQVNAKNSYGGYTGWSTYRLLFNGRALVRVVSISPQGVERTLL